MSETLRQSTMYDSSSEDPLIDLPSRRGEPGGHAAAKPVTPSGGGAGSIVSIRSPFAVAFIRSALSSPEIIAPTVTRRDGLAIGLIVGFECTHKVRHEAIRKSSYP